MNTTSGYVRGTPTAAGVFIVPVSATNAAGTSNATLTITIDSLPPLPDISATLKAYGTVGSWFSEWVYPINAPASGFTLANLPPGLAYDQSTQYISSTPTAAGTFEVLLTGANAAGTSTSILSITIAALRGPQIQGAAAVKGAIGVAFNYTISTQSLASSFSATNLPPGLNLNTATRNISGTPGAQGVFQVAISATNAVATAQAAFTIIIESAVAVQAPVISSAAGASCLIGTAFSYKITATNAPASFSAVNLPAGLSFVPATGVISGIPAITGFFSIPISASNAGGTSRAALALQILSTPALVFQWKRDGLPLAAATGQTFNLRNATLADAGSYSATITNSAGSASSQAAVLVVTTTSIGNWRRSHFSTAEINAGYAADSYSFRGDGTSNLMNYALGCDPRTGLGGNKPVVSMGAGGNHLKIEFSRDASKSDISIVVEASTDLAAWAPIAASMHGGAPVNMGGASMVSETGGVIRNVTVVDNAEIGAMKARYLRLKVQNP